ncbi:hypothetical protein F183_A26570 [Bryobacterales bacterium F-183]|nr:hypothetical protein F183_A26570 [Bryobacterales bacterium F-183]
MNRYNNLAIAEEMGGRPRLIVVNQFSERRRMNVQKSMSQMFAKLIAIFVLLSASNWLLGGENVQQKQPPVKSVREAAIEQAVAKMESRHFELHNFYIPPTQGNLQWLVTSVGAKPGETILVWKLMKDWEARRTLSTSAVASAPVLPDPS